MYVCCVLMIFFLLSLLQVSKEELAKLVQGFEKQDILQSSGVTLAGTRYIYLSGTERVIRAKLNKVGVHCMKTGQGINKNAFLFLVQQLFLITYLNLVKNSQSLSIFGVHKRYMYIIIIICIYKFFSIREK